MVMPEGLESADSDVFSPLFDMSLSLFLSLYIVLIVIYNARAWRVASIKEG